MATTIGELDLEAAAKKAAGNWEEFDSFWHVASDHADSGDWTIVCPHNSDGKLLEKSNAAVIARILHRFTEGDDPNVVAERHGNFSVDWGDAYRIRVYREGEITDAFTIYHELVRQIAKYGVLDEADYSLRVYEATLRNIGQSRLRNEYTLPNSWEAKVLAWLWEHKQSAIENTHDDGGWPEKNDLTSAFEALGYSKAG